MKPHRPIDGDLEPRNRLQFSLFSLLSLMTLLAVGLALAVYYPRFAVLIVTGLVAAIALYFSDRILRIANTELWAALTEATSAIVGTMFVVLSIVCHLKFGWVEEKSGTQIWLLTLLLAIAGLLCYYHVWKSSKNRVD